MELETTPTPTPAPAPKQRPARSATHSSTHSSMVERKLVTLRQITRIRSTCSLRFKCLEVATVTGGPEVVIRRGKWHVGDWVLFCDVDSFIPAGALKTHWLMRHTITTFDGQKGYHVRSRMVGKNLSQGHLMAIQDHAVVHRIVTIMKEEYGPQEGLRVAAMMGFEDVMGVKKWEAEDDSDTPTP